MRCHDGGHPKAPKIDPVKHSFHKVFDPGLGPDGQPREVDLLSVDYRNIKETGGQCVNCHMPQTAYMQRHWRHDHGFTIPDPLLTRDHGIPNACNRCHQDKDTAWSLRYVEEWYGKKMERPYRQRAQTVAAARAGAPDALPRLRTMLASEEHPYWLSAAANLAAGWVDNPDIAAALERLLVHTNALVRSESLHALAALPEPRPPRIQELLRRGLTDPVRVVRWRAAEASRATLDLASPVGREYLAALDHQSDQPGGQMQWAALAMSRGDFPTAIERYQKAIAWDPRSAPIRHDLAIVFTQAGRPRDAVNQLEEACRLEPNDPDFAFRLGLAWNEAGDLERAMRALERAVQIDPGHARAWYNLGLARNARGDIPGALQALEQAGKSAPRDPGPPYARATILMNQGRRREAAAAARQALEIAPDFRQAAAILQSLSQ
jgi:tetratricopeptide (TPR) repeat protein